VPRATYMKLVGLGASGKSDVSEHRGNVAHIATARRVS
jgi:hypothetical protein